MNPVLSIDPDRLRARIRELGEVGALPGGGVCRLALTEEDRRGRDLVRRWMDALGLDVEVDELGNVVGTRAGVEPGPPVMTGSHIDTVRTGGLYDGNLGVLAGLEVIATLNDAAVQTRHPVAVAFFTNEEGARFAPDMMGSLAFVGDLSVSAARQTVGIDGTTVGENLDRIGYRGTVACGRRAVRAFLELHVEQGPVLEDHGVAIGVVEGVSGISWTELTLEGVSNHAGTTPMANRHDAGYAAASIAHAVRGLAVDGGLATVGSLALFPNLVNVIARRATMTVDLRHPQDKGLAEAEKALAALVRKTAADADVEVRTRSLARFAPVLFDPEIIAMVGAAADRRGYRTRALVSGAGHDAQILARICPSGMIFVPSVGGISHNVLEHTHAQDIEAGANVLLDVVIQLADSTDA